MRNVAPAENKLKVICVGTGRDGTQSCTHMLRHLLGERAQERVMHEFRAGDFYNLHATYCETGSSRPLTALKRIIADCPHECIVGNGYAAVLPLFAQRYGRDLTLVHLRRRDRDACIASLMRNAQLFPTVYGYYTSSPLAAVKRMTAFHFGEMSRQEWDRLPPERKFGWFYDKTHALIEEHSALFGKYVPMYTEELNGEVARQSLAEVVGAGETIPPPAHLDASLIDISSLPQQHWHRMRWLMRQFNLHEVATDDVYALGHFAERFVALAGYQIRHAPQLAPDVPPPAEKIANNLSRAEAVLSRSLHEIDELWKLLCHGGRTPQDDIMYWGADATGVSIGAGYDGGTAGARGVPADRRHEPSEHRAALAEHEAALSERERELSEHRAALADREATLAERDRELAEHQTALAEREATLAERDRELIEHRVALDKLHGELAERQTEVEEHRTALAGREAALADYRAALGELQGAFAEYNAVGDRELAEHRAALAEQDARLANREQTIAAYGALAAQRDATIAERDSELAEHRGALVERDAVIAEYRAIAAQRDATIAARERELGEHRTALAHREAQLADRDVELAEHRCALADREGTLVDRDRELAERSGALAERDRELAELRGELADLAHELAESRATLAEREQRLTSLYRSYSWRVQAPVRGVRRLLVGGA